jgi:hypothetical protein
MSSDGTWRFAFVLGFFLTAVLGVAVYGGATLLPVISVCAALTVVVNGILGGSRPGERPYLERVARSALSAGWFFRLVTVIAWIGVIAIGATALMHRLRPTREIMITGRVYAADGTPAAFARVEIPTGKGSAVCDASGVFALTADIDRNAANIAVRARRGGYHVNQVAQLDAANPQARIDVTLTLPKETPPFRILYRYLKGRAVDLFLDPPRKELWDSALQTGAFTVQNDVHGALRDVANRFAAPARHSVFYVSVGEGGRMGEPKEQLANDPPDRRAFAGSNGENNGNGFDQHFDLPISDTDAPALLASHTNWAVLQRKPEQTFENHLLPETVPLFRRGCDRDDLARFGEKSLLARFYSYVASGNVPPDLAWVDLSIDYNACGDQEAAQLTLTGRLLVVEVVDMENTTNEPLDVGAFDFHQSTVSMLRAADDAAANEAQAQRTSWFSPQILRPGERILIPTRLLLEFAPEYPFGHSDRNLPQVADANALTPEMLSRFASTPADIVPLLANAPPSLDRRYVWGPSIVLDDVQIEGLAYPIRAAASRNTLVLSGNEIGSCPYFSVYSRGVGWVPGGTILTGRNSPHRGGTDRRLLPAFDGRVLLEEREHEETFITRLAVEVTTDDGHLHLLRSTTPMPLRLKFGDRLEVFFRDMPARPIAQATLVADGYYVAVVYH